MLLLGIEPGKLPGGIGPMLKFGSIKGENEIVVQKLSKDTQKKNLQSSQTHHSENPRSAA